MPFFFLFFFCPSHPAQFKDPFRAKAGLRDRRGERGDRAWKWLMIINCISTGSSARHLPPVASAAAWLALITLRSGCVRVWGAEALCCCKMSQNYYTLLCVRRQSMTLLVFKPASVFQTPLGQNCLPHSVARGPPPPTAESLCSLWLILRLCATASSLHRLPCAHSAPFPSPR